MASRDQLRGVATTLGQGAISAQPQGGPTWLVSQPPHPPSARLPARLPHLHHQALLQLTFINTDSLSFSRLTILMATFWQVTQ